MGNLVHENSPSLFSALDFPPFFDDDDDDEEEEAADVDGTFLNTGITSDSSHMWERT